MICYPYVMDIVPSSLPQSLPASRWQRNCLVAILLLVIVVGISLRFFGLAQRNIWIDEAHTLRNISPIDVRRLKGQELTRMELDKQMHPTFDIDGVWQICGNTSQTSDQVPLYYLLARYFCSFFDDSLFAARLLSALLSIAATPLFYFWSFRVTRSKMMAAIGALIVSVSPFLTLYSSEARGYTLWVVLIILSNHMCWRMDRHSDSSSALKYGFVLCALTMSHLASLLIVPGHALFMLFSGVKKKVILISFAPLWILGSIWKAYQGKMDIAFERILSTGWMSEPRPIDVWLERLSAAYGRFVYDDGSFPTNGLIALVPIGCLIGGFLVKTSTRHRLYFMALLTYPLILAGLDLTLGGVRAITLRYQAPVLILFLLEASLVIGALIANNSTTQRVFGCVLLATMVVAGLASGFSIATKNEIWIKESHVDLKDAKEFMEDKERPLFLCPSFEIAIVASKSLPERARVKVPHKKMFATIAKETDGVRILNCRRLEYGTFDSSLVRFLREKYPALPITEQEN